MTATRWGAPGDVYDDASRARRQLVGLRNALAWERRFALSAACGSVVAKDARHEAAWSAGHHAGRVFRAREMARDAAMAARRGE